MSSGLGTAAFIAKEGKRRLVAAARAAIDQAEPGNDVLVAYGYPGDPEQMPDDVFSFGRVTRQLAPGPRTNAGGALRDMVITFYATVSVFRPGEADQEQVANDRAYDLIDYVAEYLRVTDPTLGGVMQWIYHTDDDAEGASDPEYIAQGRTIEITAAFTGQTRVGT